MRLSRYFLPVLKENPAEAQIVSHRLMLRAGMIKQSSAGIYSWLPLGFKVLRKLEDIVHEEQIRAGHIPMLMPTLQSADLWRESGRYEAYGQEMLRIKDRHERDMLYGPTNEELITDIFRTHVGSYKDLPMTLYHIQWKFRDEIRPRFGVMRGREFFMKDGYNFDIDRDSALHAYNRHLVSYLKTYERMGLQAIPMRADSGPIGGDDTHEFLVLAETGESEVFYDSAITDLKIGDRVVDYDSREDCASILRNGRRPMRARMKLMMRRFLRKSRRSAKEKAVVLKSDRSFTLAPNIQMRWARRLLRKAGSASPCIWEATALGSPASLGPS